MPILQQVTGAIALSAGSRTCSCDLPVIWAPHHHFKTTYPKPPNEVQTVSRVTLFSNSNSNYNVHAQHAQLLVSILSAATEADSAYPIIITEVTQLLEDTNKGKEMSFLEIIHTPTTLPDHVY